MDKYLLTKKQELSNPSNDNYWHILKPIILSLYGEKRTLNSLNKKEVKELKS